MLARYILAIAIAPIIGCQKTSSNNQSATKSSPQSAISSDSSPAIPPSVERQKTASNNQSSAKHPQQNADNNNSLSVWNRDPWYQDPQALRMLRGTRTESGKFTHMVYVDTVTGHYAATINTNLAELDGVVVYSGAEEDFISALNADLQGAHDVVAPTYVDRAWKNLRPLTPEEFVSLRRRLAR